jgi:hypothetical protein
MPHISSMKVFILPPNKSRRSGDMANKRSLSLLSLLLLGACASTPNSQAPSETAKSELPPLAAEAVSPPTVETKKIEAAFVLTRGKGTGLNRFVIVGVTEEKIAALASTQGKVHLFDASSGQYSGELDTDKTLIGARHIARDGSTLIVASPQQQNAMMWRYQYKSNPMGAIKYQGPKDPLSFESVTTPDGVNRLISIEDQAGKREFVTTEFSVVQPRLNNHLSIDSFTFKELKRSPLDLGKPGELTSMTFDPDLSRLLISSGSALAAFDYQGKRLSTTLPVVDRPIFGVQVRHCDSGFGGILLIGSKVDGEARVDIFEIKNNEKIGSFAVPEVKNPTQMMFFPATMEYFPAGAIYFAESGESIVGADWATIAKATGVRQNCF